VARTLPIVKVNNRVKRSEAVSDFSMTCGLPEPITLVFDGNKNGIDTQWAVCSDFIIVNGMKCGFEYKVVGELQEETPRDILCLLNIS
jgi:hypothetical protein